MRAQRHWKQLLAAQNIVAGMLEGMSGHTADDKVALEKATQEQWKRTVRGTIPGDDTPKIADF